MRKIYSKDFRKMLFIKYPKQIYKNKREKVCNDRLENQRSQLY